jgi:uncharacterized membrane protein (DUF4010 family)
MDIGPAFEALVVSLGLGLLVGLQRERVGTRIGGVRTFPLITMLGTVCALLAQSMGNGWIVAAGLIAVVAATAVGNMVSLKVEGERDVGITTEIAMLVMYGLGAYAAVGPKAVVLAAGVVVAVLLHAKGPLHAWAGRVGDPDMRAILLFAAITFVVLPVLPDRGFGPFGVWNPRNIWLMVVLVVGLSLGGYVAYKLFGAQAGSVLSGILGGLISSTAATVGSARRSREADEYAGPAALVIVIASCVLYGRVLTEISVASPTLFQTAVWPIGIVMAVSAAMAAAVWLTARRDGESLPEQENPTQLKSALFFAALYAMVLLAVAVGREYWGTRGVYAVAAISGLTDMDAITLSSARMVSAGEIEAAAAWRAVLLASISNLVFKTGAVAVLGSRRLLWRVAAVFGAQAVAAGLVMVLWR